MLFPKIMDDKDQEQELLVDGYVSPTPAEFQWRNWAKDEEGLTGEALESFLDGCPLAYRAGGVPGATTILGRAAPTCASLFCHCRRQSAASCEPL
jgi:hypothetical protein